MIDEYVKKWLIKAKNEKLNINAADIEFAYTSDEEEIEGADTEENENNSEEDPF